MLTENQLDWLAEQAGWNVDHTKLHPYQRNGDILDVNPSTSLDRLIADHDGWMLERSIWYLVQRQRGLDGQWHWTAEMWSRHLDAPVWFDADTPEAALAEAFYAARGGPQ